MNLRRTPEQEQERQSRLQLALAWKDWPLQSSVEDLGEDLLFQVYADGRSTGLSFYVQLKSTRDINAHFPKRRTDTLFYDLETKDLLHWEGSVPPVVLVLWDVEKQRGVWQDVPEILRTLDGHGGTWRAKESVRVHLPRSHITDAAGRDFLRARLADLALPMLSAGKEMVVKPTFSFPNTVEGKAALEAFRKTIDEGGSVTLGKEFIKTWRMSDWWERPYGVRIPDSITISSSDFSGTLCLYLQVVEPEQTETLPLHLKRTKAGMKQATFETERASPLHMTLVLHEADDGQTRLQMNVRFEHPCSTVHDSLALTRFLIALKRGGSLQVALPNGRTIGPSALDSTGGGSLEELLRWEAVLKKLSYIQSRTGRFGSFTVTKLSGRDVPAIERVYGILKTGLLETRMSFNATLDPTKKMAEPDRQEIRLVAAKSVSCFGPVVATWVRRP